MLESVHTMNGPMGFDDLPPAGAQVTRLRVPPHSIEAEQGTLGALLIEPDALAKIADVLTEADFYRHEHRLIFGCITSLVSAGHPVDMITVFEQLQAQGVIHDVGGLAYLNDVANSVPGATNIRRHAEIVAERSALRAVIAASDEMATAAFNPQGRRAITLLDEARTTVGRLIEKSGTLLASRLPVLTGPELVASAQLTQWLVKGILPAQAVGMMFGASGTFKSFIALDMALHIAHGLPFMGRRTKPGNVLWVAAEGGSGFGFRVDAWHRARNLEPSKNLIGIPASIDLGTDAWRVVDAIQAKAIAAPALVVVDTLSQTYTAGGDENSSTDMAAYLREIGRRFRDLWGCTVLLIHHSGHNATERPRGSSAIQANTNFLFGVFRDEKEMLAKITCAHQKEGDRFEDATFSMLKLDLGADSDGDRITHLAARHLNTQDDVYQAQAAEKTAGRGGKRSLLVTLAQNGMTYAALRKAFYQDCGLDNAESQRQAFGRAVAAAKKDGSFEIVEGFILINGRQK